MNVITFTHIEFMRKACLEADKATCLYKVGCVAVKDGKIVLKTFNETLPGEIYCQGGKECIRKKLNLKNGNQIHLVCTSHAEINLIAEASLSGFSLKAADVYVSTFPCVICSKALTKAKIGKFYYMSDYAGNEGLRYFKAASIPVKQIREAEVWEGKDS